MVTRKCGFRAKKGKTSNEDGSNGFLRLCSVKIGLCSSSLLAYFFFVNLCCVHVLPKSYVTVDELVVIIDSVYYSRVVQTCSCITLRYATIQQSSVHLWSPPTNLEDKESKIYRVMHNCNHLLTCVCIFPTSFWFFG